MQNTHLEQSLYPLEGIIERILADGARLERLVPRPQQRLPCLGIEIDLFRRRSVDKCVHYPHQRLRRWVRPVLEHRAEEVEILLRKLVRLWITGG